MTTDGLTLPLEAADIMRIIPHRYPFLLIDRVVELEPGQRVVAIKNVTANEPQFTGHFPDRPIMPGVLMVEALAQAGAVGVLSHPDYASRLAVFAGIDGVRFRRLVEPGDVLDLELTVDRLRETIGRGAGRVSVGDQTVLEGTLMFGFVDAVPA